MFTTKVLIIVVFLFIVAIDFGYSSNPIDIVLNETEIDQVACQSKKCLRKCCPKGQYVANMSCKSIDDVKGNFDVEKISIYDDYYPSYKVNKNFSEIFLLVPGRFLEVIGEINNTFDNEAITVTYPMHLSESGKLYINLINSYIQWYPVNHFCVDFDIQAKDTIFYMVFINDQPSKDKKMYYIVAALVSSVLLSIVLLVYILLPELRNLAGLILMAYVFSQLSAFISLSALQLSEKHSICSCIYISAFTYFSFLASFFWLNIMSFDIWWTFRGFAKTRPIHTTGRIRAFALYCLYAWGIPFLMAVGMVILTQVDMSSIPSFVTPQIPQQGCFLEQGQKLVYLYYPMLILIISNWMFFLMTVFNMWRLYRSTSMLDSTSAGSAVAHRKQKNRLLVYLKLSVVMGINWILEIGSYLAPKLPIWIVFDSYNLFIGLFIFIIFVGKKEIYIKLRKRYCKSFNSTPNYAETNSNCSTTTSPSSNSIKTQMQVHYRPTGTD